MPGADSSAPANTPTPHCPRCGYDQSGMVAMWTNERDGASCPLHGRCSECGLEFDWADLFGFDRHRLLGLYEHAPRVWNVRWAARTWVMAMWPSRFWTWVKMHHEIVPRRLAVWTLVFMLVLHVGSAVVQNLLAIPVAFRMQTPRPGWGSLTASLGEYLAVGVEPWLAPVVPRRITVELCGRVERALVGGTTPSAPLEMELTAIMHVSAVLLSATAMAGVMLLVLPDTRARLKIRRGHVARAVVYGCAFTIAAFAALNLWRLGCAGAISVGSRDWFTQQWYGPSRHYWYWLWQAQMPAIVLGLLWHAWWWRSAITHGLKFDRPRLVWLVVVIPSWIVAAITLIYLPGFAELWRSTSLY